MLVSPDQQISLTDKDCRSMATSGRGSGMVAYNVQAAVDTGNHLIVAHEVTNVGTDRSQLASMAVQAKLDLDTDKMEEVVDRGDRGDQGLRRNRHHRDFAKAADLGRRIGRPFRQAGFCLSSYGGCLHLSGRGKAEVLRHCRGKRAADAPLLDQCMRHLSAQSSARNVASLGGSTSTWSRRCRSGSTRTRRRCACAARRLSIRSAH